MKLSLIRSMTRSAVFELENGLCYRPAHPFTVQLNGEGMCRTVAQAVFQLKHGAAGHGTNQGKLHKQDASLDVERFMGCPQVAGMF